MIECVAISLGDDESGITLALGPVERKRDLVRPLLHIPRLWGAGSRRRRGLRRLVSSAGAHCNRRRRQGGRFARRRVDLQYGPGRLHNPATRRQCGCKLADVATVLDENVARALRVDLLRRCGVDACQRAKMRHCEIIHVHVGAYDLHLISVARRRRLRDRLLGGQFRHRRRRRLIERRIARQGSSCERIRE